MNMMNCELKLWLSSINFSLRSKEREHSSIQTQANIINHSIRIVLTKNLSLALTVYDNKNFHISI